MSDRQHQNEARTETPPNADRRAEAERLDDRQQRTRSASDAATKPAPHVPLINDEDMSVPVRESIREDGPDGMPAPKPARGGGAILLIAGVMAAIGVALAAVLFFVPRDNPSFIVLLLVAAMVCVAAAPVMIAGILRERERSSKERELSEQPTLF